MARTASAEIVGFKREHDGNGPKRERASAQLRPFLFPSSGRPSDHAACCVECCRTAQPGGTPCEEAPLACTEGRCSGQERPAHRGSDAYPSWISTSVSLVPPRLTPSPNIRSVTDAGKENDYPRKGGAWQAEFLSENPITRRVALSATSSPPLYHAGAVQRVLEIPSQPG